MTDIIESIRKELKKQSDIKVKKSGERFFKEEIKLYGVKTAVVTKIGKEFYKEIKNSSKKEIFEYCELLWQSGYMEESFIACNWSYYIKKDYSPGDFKIFERWVKKYVTNWAACDTLCNHTIGTFLDKYPEYISELKKWCKSENRWVRRASAVSLIVPARQGKFLREIFEIADLLLTDKDDLVQKGYGWMLKEASKPHLDEVFNYVMNKKSIMPRTSLRYSIEKMPEELKKKAMVK